MSARLLTLGALTVLAAACNPAVSKDNQLLSHTLDATEDPNVFASVFGAEFDVSPAARELRVEIGITATGILQEGSSTGLLVLGGLTQLGSASGSEETSADFEFEPNVADCTGDLYYSLREDGWCTVQLAALVSGAGPYSMITGFNIKAFAEKDWEGDELDVEVFVSVEEGQAEATTR